MPRLPQELDFLSIPEAQKVERASFEMSNSCVGLCKQKGLSTSRPTGKITILSSPTSSPSYMKTTLIHLLPSQSSYRAQSFPILIHRAVAHEHSDRSVAAIDFTQTKSTKHDFTYPVPPNAN